MASIMTYDNNLMDLPNELIKMVLDKMNDDDLIMQIEVHEFTSFVFELLKERLTRLSMRNLVLLYTYENMQNEVRQHLNSLPSFKYKELKEVYQSETDLSSRHLIENLTANYFVNIVGQAVPEGMNFIKQIDTIRAILLTTSFMELVETNGGPFHLFTAFNETIERKIIHININLVNTGITRHSYPLTITVGSTSNRILISRGTMIEGECECNFNSVFLRLYNSIIQNYSFNEMTITTQIVGNNVIGQLNEEFSM